MSLSVVRMLAALAVAIAPGVAAQVPEATAAAVRAHAEAAKFDGAILIGEKDGTSQILVLGADPVAPDAVWRWASITKQLTAVIAMQEVAAGRLDLDASVSSYWPEWQAPNAGTIRIRDLLLHNSGLPQPDDSPADADGVPAFYRAAAVSPAASAASFCAGRAREAAPATFNYNNCDSIVLAEILGRVSGKPFDQLVHERFAQKLGMKQFGMFRLGDPIRDHVQPTGEFSEIDPLINLGVYGPSGGAYGTIGDLWLFDHALLSGRLVPARERDLMWQSSRQNGFYGLHQWIFPARLAGCSGETRIVERQGQVGGIELRNFLLPETGQAVILFSRHRPSGYGDPWEGKGFAYDLLSAVACR